MASAHCKFFWEMNFPREMKFVKYGYAIERLNKELFLTSLSEVTLLLHYCFYLFR